MKGSFEEAFRQSRRLVESVGRTSSNAYEDNEEGVYNSLLASLPDEEAVLPPEEGDEAEEPVLLGELPKMPEEKKEEANDSLCLSILESIIDSPFHFAPRPVTDEFVLLGAVQKYKDLYLVYQAMKKALRDKQENVTVLLDGEERPLKTGASRDHFRVDHPSRNLQYASEEAHIHYSPTIGENDTFFWVIGKNSGDTLGYCVEGWLYTRRKEK